MNQASFPWVRRAAIGVVTGAVFVTGWFVFGRDKPMTGPAHAVAAESSGDPVRVEVTQPKPGGLERTSTQPGTVEPFEAADLYAKVSSFLVEQPVDIGSYVKAGDVLARISVPEYEKQVARDTAQVRDADAKVQQMDAHLKAAQAEAKAADAAVALSKVLVRAKTPYRRYR